MRLQKLNQQAVLEASSMQEELTKETLISCGKVHIFIANKITNWVKNVLYTGLSRRGDEHLCSMDIDSGCLTGGHSFDFHLVQICVMNTISSVFGCHCFIIY